MTSLYHATIKELELSQTLRFDTAVACSHSPDRQLVEEFMKENCPKGDFVSRIGTWYACDKPEFAHAYLRAEFTNLLTNPDQSQKEIFIYEVEMPEPRSRHPFYLISKIGIALNNNDLEIAKLYAKEYWVPTQEWKFWEYLNSEITVHRKVATPSLITQSFFAMGNPDRKVFESLFG